ncbi:MAG: CAP domain-containing protein [Actinomycetaceae bacterium]|nr:CAP domain-containing protein [Actinomycetaceae bacterium]
MRTAPTFATTTLALVIGMGVGAPATHAVPAEPVAAAASTQESAHAETILNRVNQLRASQGLQPVTRYVELDSVAQDWSETMRSTGTMQHRPNFSASYPSGWTGASENVAMAGGSVNADIGNQLFDLWLNSPGHYTNMVDPNATAIGIGVAFDEGTQTWYGTQNFAAYGADAQLTATSASTPAPAAPSVEAPASPAPAAPQESVPAKQSDDHADETEEIPAAQEDPASGESADSTDDARELTPLEGQSSQGQSAEEEATADAPASTPVPVAATQVTTPQSDPSADPAPQAAAKTNAQTDSLAETGVNPVFIFAAGAFLLVGGVALLGRRLRRAH